MHVLCDEQLTPEYPHCPGVSALLQVELHLCYLAQFMHIFL